MKNNDPIFSYNCFLMIGLSLLSACHSSSAPETRLSTSPWELIWQDEFDELNHNKWSLEVNCWGGGNDEQQCYTDRSDNAFVKQGILNIVARKEVFAGPATQDDQPDYDRFDTSASKPYTSARLRTKYKGDWTYGRFEVRAKLPHGQGTWPAIWMLPTDNIYGSWPASGEIDIMEAVNLGTRSDRPEAKAAELEARIHGTLHYGRQWPQNVYSGTGYRLPDDASPADDFHLYAVEWQPGEIRWYVDDVHYATQKAGDWYSQYQDDNGKWIMRAPNAPFDARYHLILNLAVGGAWAANVNEQGVDETIFPQTLMVDFVRVYRCADKQGAALDCGYRDPAAKHVKGKQPPDPDG